MTPDQSTAPSSASDAGAVELQRERDDLYDRLLRTTAEFDNYRKRVDRERRDLFDATATEVVRDLLPIIDDFERALTAPAAADDAFRRGVELIHRRLLDLLRTRGVEPFDSVGQIFDPAIHEAIATEPVGKRREGEIVAEFGRGYRLNGRLLRPARVKVAQS